MNQFVERLPWRIAALAGLIVGGISLLTGADPWTSLLRLSAAFVVFGAAGLALRVLLQNAESSSPPAAQGHHFDQTTPGDSSEEPTSSTSSNAGDKH
jgi:drug/metabolite transporter (DMT)-like permease